MGVISKILKYNKFIMKKNENFLCNAIHIERKGNRVSGFEKTNITIPVCDINGCFLYCKTVRVKKMIAVGVSITEVLLKAIERKLKNYKK